VTPTRTRRCDRLCHNLGVVNFLIRVVVNGIALWVAAWLVSGVHLGEEGASTTTNVVTVLLVALIFGVVNAVVKPIITILSIPFVIVTLGLFLVVLNALFLELVAWISDLFGLAFSIDDFWWDAIWAALIISVVSWALSLVLPEDDRRTP
jgi:putative membrane protein